MTIDDLKKLACDTIDRNKEKIIELGDSVFEEPELGFKEFNTAEKIKNIFDEIGITYKDKVAITGVVAPLKGKSSKIRVAVMGELDAVVAPGHRCANKKSSAAHSCGHNAMLASLIGVGYALVKGDIMKHLSGDVVLMAVPAEEYVEIEYRNRLKNEGKIHFLGGKQEFVRLGEMDNIDIMVMQHTSTNIGEGIKACCGSNNTGFLGKLVKYKGQAAHAGGSPHVGVNALNAANIGLMAVNAQRETFKDEDNVRVHPIVTKGGDLVNVVPDDVHIETYIRANNIDAIIDANKKVTRAFKAGGDAVGAETIITDLPGYLPIVPNYDLYDIMYSNMKKLFEEDSILYEYKGGAGSTDAGDISYLMPTIHSYFVGASGTAHSSDYEISNKDIAYIAAAKCLAMTVIDLLAEDAEQGIEIKESYKAVMSKEEYLKIWGKL